MPRTPTYLLVFTLVPIPVDDTEQNIPFSELQQIERQKFVLVDALNVQFIPSGDVMIRFVPSDDTAENSPNSGLQHTEVHD